MLKHVERYNFHNLHLFDSISFNIEIFSSYIQILNEIDPNKSTNKLKLKISLYEEYKFPYINANILIILFFNL